MHTTSDKSTPGRAGGGNASSCSPVPLSLMSAILNARKTLGNSFQEESGKINSLEQSLFTMDNIRTEYVKDLVVTLEGLVLFWDFYCCCSFDG